MWTAGLAEAADEGRRIRLEEDQPRGDTRERLQPPEYAWELLQEAALAHVGDDRNLLEARVRPRRELGHRRNQGRREVVYAEEAEIFQRANGVGLPGPRQARQDDKTARAARRGTGLARRLSRQRRRRRATSRGALRRHTGPPCSTSSSALVSASASRSCASSRVASSRA